MRRVKLSRQEKQIEEALVKGAYIKADRETFSEIAEVIKARKKDAVLNIRVNSQDLRDIKRQARKLGVRYQAFIAEVLHQIAQGKT